MGRSFELGQVVTTAGVHERMTADANFSLFVYTSLFAKYLNGDWGNLTDHDNKMNDRAVI